jgi:hypothetical protein
MIKLRSRVGFFEDGPFIHVCGPEVRGPLCGGRARCDCGPVFPDACGSSEHGG